jgi:2-C-methyl-D-erythritol 4-phosphate cytidylyltransferase / 2-C-methyl-D-erythritol 2,4-cyclodiphosphate synthase
MRVGAVILAAGSGARFGSDKSLLTLRGKPLWKWSFDTFMSHGGVAVVGVVASEANVEAIRGEAQGAAFVVTGGSTRRDSSRIGVERLAESCDILLVHDGARPFVSHELIDRVIAAVQRSGASGPALPPVDAVKLQESDGLRTLDRERVVTVQTPQGADRKTFLRAHVTEGDAPDDLALFERIGVRPELVSGEPDNIKITAPGDLARARYIIGMPETRTGLGYDIHQFSSDPERPLMIGGVRFEGGGLDGHSDADALLHAAVDALLGAAGMGDIGQHFPNNDPRWKDEPSINFLKHAGSLLDEANWRIVNLDLTVVAEAPKIMARAEEMRNIIGSALGLEPQRINIKATTNEGLGALGRGEGLAALAIATIIEKY